MKLSHHDWLVKTPFVRLIVSYGFMLSMSLVILGETKLEDFSQPWISSVDLGRQFNRKLEFGLTGLLAFIEYCMYN